MPDDSIWDSRPRPWGSSRYTPPTGGTITPAMEALAKQLVVRNAFSPGLRIIRTPEIPMVNARGPRPFIAMFQTGSGRPILNIAGQDPVTWRAAGGTAQKINAAQAQNAAAIAERMAAYNAARNTTTPVAGSRPVIQVGANAGPSIFGRLGGGGPKIMGR